MIGARKFTAIFFLGAISACAHERALVPLPEYADTDAWGFVDRPIGERQFVLLGESIHLTAELPRARLPVIRRLHRALGFDVIAFEGSMIDAWMAADALLRGEDARAAAGLAWFEEWWTPDMLAVMSYIASTRDSARPLYLASMDIQPGLGASETKEKMLELFAARVFEYAGRPLEEAKTIAAALAGARRCNLHNPGEARAAADALESAIRAADAKVREKSAMHADTLGLIPGMLRQRFVHCGVILKPDGQVDWKVYKEDRDRYQAENMIALQEKVSRSGKIFGWAHHSHFAYLGSHGGRSIGSELKRLRPGRVYSLGLFADSGRCSVIRDGDEGGRIPVDLPAWDGDRNYSGMIALRGLGPGAKGYFLDFSRARSDPRMQFLSAEHIYFDEGGPSPMVLDREFDGLILVPEISDPSMESL